MLWSVIALTFSTMLELVTVGRLSAREEDLEILILRHQLDILERKRTELIKPSKAEKLTRALQKPCLNRFLSIGSANRLLNVLARAKGNIWIENQIGDVLIKLNEE